MSGLRDRIISTFEELWAEDHTDPAPELKDDTVLLETGIDSMGFAVFVTMLDDELGFDPFAMDSEAVYPVSFGEFVAFYEKHAPA
ncbi:acyl carrier protein [Novosphingobium mangrovi (ex Huang et al. 2023)]|uniref:Acyl carrier protein n=1 Tax=Novosphingobium mangrovi (ex Huang et al. 2023) TaxID=2976432 RepID=A0ABT2I0T1_9SPHN|nr:acyl carrier protein [Novosphingobium mangrovi (ex Huang et al. 2023)]MCT2398417.1 acyl carrier protein [Novosphingobium mangrovi (ex Huang et al. 2023)]